MQKKYIKDYASKNRPDLKFTISRMERDHKFYLEVTHEHFTVIEGELSSNSDDLLKHALSMIEQQLEQHVCPHFESISFGFTPIQMFFNERKIDPKEFELHKRVAENDTEAARQLVERGADVNQLNHKFATPLIIALSNNNHNMVELLLRAGANPNAAPPVFERKRPLSIAVAMEVPEAVRLLLDYGADVNCADSHGNTSLIDAARQGNLGLVELLIKYGAKVNQKNKENITPLTIASALGMREIAEVLLNAGAAPNVDGENSIQPLIGACEEGRLDIVRLLVENGADVNNANNGDFPLGAAALAGFKEIVEFLLDNGADVNLTTPNGNALMKAVGTGNTEIVKLLLRRGADPDIATESGINPLMVARETGHQDMLPLLTHRFMHQDGIVAVESTELEGTHVLTETEKLSRLITEAIRSYYGSPSGLIESAKIILLASIEEALQSGSNPNEVDNRGISALLHVCMVAEGLKNQVFNWIGRRENLETEEAQEAISQAFEAEILASAQALLSKGADPNYVFRHQDLEITPLTAATMFDHSALASFLLESGAMLEPGIRTSPLYEAVARGNLFLARLFLAKGANANFADPNGYTILMVAAEAGGIANKDEETWFRSFQLSQREKQLADLASAGVFDEIVDLLLAAGAKKDLRDNKNQTALDVALRGKNEYLKSVLAF